VSRVLLFSTSTCSWCRRAKRYFKEHRVAFKEINVERDQDAAREIVRKTGQAGVPVIKIGSRWDSPHGKLANAGRWCPPADRPAALQWPRTPLLRTFVLLMYLSSLSGA
jgi:glutaredoxin 3